MLKITDIKTKNVYKIINIKTNLVFYRNPSYGECNTLSEDSERHELIVYNFNGDTERLLRRNLRIEDDNVIVYVRSKGFKSRVYQALLKHYPDIEFQDSNYLRLPLKDFELKIIKDYEYKLDTFPRG